MQGMRVSLQCVVDCVYRALRSLHLATRHGDRDHTRKMVCCGHGGLASPVRSYAPQWLCHVDVVPLTSPHREAIGTAFTRLHNH